MSRNEILTPSLLRMDGRRPFEFRSMEIHLSPHRSSSSNNYHGGGGGVASSSSTSNQADGSARLVQGLNDVTCIVSGPRERIGGGGAAGGSGEGAKVDFEVANENASNVGQERRPQRGRNDRRTQDITTALTSLFTPLISTHLYPRTSAIRISLLVTSSDGSLLSTLINASTLALLDAGIPLKDYCLSTSLAFHPPMRGNADTLLLDPTSTEESDLPTLTIAVTPRDGQVGLQMLDAGRGKVQGERIVAALKVGVEVLRGRLLQEVEVAVKGWARALEATGGA